LLAVFSQQFPRKTLWFRDFPAILLYFSMFYKKKKEAFLNFGEIDKIHKELSMRKKDKNFFL
jgi:hypothetical protein